VVTKPHLGGPKTSSFVWMSEMWIHADYNRMTYNEQPNYMYYEMQ